MPNKFVIDTSLFVNPDARKKFGKNPSAAVRSFVKKLSKVDMEVYMPPSVFKELYNFIDQKATEEIELAVRKRSPNTYSIYLPAAVFHDFIEDIRGRINKGMRVAEQFAKDNRPENEEKLRRLREKYREAMRTGILDSEEDFELVLLAKELEATLVTSDEGVLKFANQIGCELLPADKFYAMMEKMKS